MTIMFREDGADSCHIVWSIEHLSPLLHEQAKATIQYLQFENIFQIF